MDTSPLAEARRVTRVLEGVTEAAEEPVEVDPTPDRRLNFTRLNFFRMRTRWNSDEQDIIDRAERESNLEILESFGDAYIILNNIFEVVRQPELRADGTIIRDDQGFPVWKKDQGLFIEDYGKLTDRHREDFIHQISIRLVLWEQKAASLWGEAMWAKAQWEERFARSFEETPLSGTKRPTEADKTQHAQSLAWDERYLSIYMSVRSKKADALIKSMDRLCQRLKDMLR